MNERLRGTHLGRFRCQDKPIPLQACTLDAVVTSGGSLKDQWRAAKTKVEQCEDIYRNFRMNNPIIDPSGPHAGPEKMLRKRLEAARERLRKIEFIAYDHAPKTPSHPQRLHELNQRNAEFWRKQNGN